MRRETFVDFFEDFATLSAQFLVYEDGYRSWSYTYREIAEAAWTFAARLEEAGIRRGDKVLLWGENRPEWIAVLWGCLLSGVVVVPLDYRASGELLVRVQQVAGARLLVSGDEVPAVQAGIHS